MHIYAMSLYHKNFFQTFQSHFRFYHINIFCP